MRILLTLPDTFPPSSSWHQMLRKYVNVALVDYLCQGFYALNTLYGTCVTWEFWLTNEISERRLENALLTGQIERQVLFCTVTSRLLHDDAKIHVTLARIYNVLENLKQFSAEIFWSGQTTWFYSTFQYATTRSMTISGLVLSYKMSFFHLWRSGGKVIFLRNIIHS